MSLDNGTVTSKPERNYRFKTTLPVVLLTVIAVGLFSGLAAWQVERARTKQAIADRINAQQALPPLSLDQEVTDIEGQRYRPVTVTGRYLAGHYVLIDNRSHNRQPGYHVIAPLRVDATGKVLLVNLGWVAWTGQRARLPEIHLPSGEVVVNGRLEHLPGRPLLAADLPANAEHERVWSYIDPAEYNAWSGLDVLPLVLLQSAADPGPYVRDWPAYESKVGMHIGYAIHWAVFALVAIAVFLWWSLRGRPNGERT